MEHLLTALARGVEGAPLLAGFTALVWGVLSVVLSPCHLASIPLIVGLIDEQGQVSPRRAFCVALVFSLGILVSIGLIGVATAAAGRLLGDVGRMGNYFVATVFFAMGLHLLGVIRIPFSGAGPVAPRRKGLWVALVVGLVFGIALGPCTFAFMAPMLAVTFRMSATHPVSGVVLLLLYGVGHCVVITAAGSFTGTFRRFLDWNESSKGTRLLRRVCGVLVLLGGLYMLYAG